MKFTKKRKKFNHGTVKRHPTGQSPEQLMAAERTEAALGTVRLDAELE